MERRRVLGPSSRMDRYRPETYGDRIADLYDDWHGGLPTAAAVDALASLAGNGPVLELGVGSGRLALPLADLGLEVHGIDTSEAMVQRLRAKPGGDRITVTIGDMADVAAEGSFSLVVAVFNALFLLLTQDDQVRCFANVAGRLHAGGRFVLECFVPDLGLYTSGTRTSAVSVGLDQVRLDVARLRPAEQRVDTQHMVIGADGVRLLPVALRYAWPSEIDLMARLAGLRLLHRWGGWGGEPFTDSSRNHISVYEKPA